MSAKAAKAVSQEKDFLQMSSDNGSQENYRSELEAIKVRNEVEEMRRRVIVAWQSCI